MISISAVLIGAIPSAAVSTDVSSSRELPEPASLAQIHRELSGLRVSAAGSLAGYSRDHFPHWTIHTNSCDTRELVLQRDGTNVIVNTDCHPLSGMWISLYDNRKISTAQQIDIDHVVPLAQAWVSGARTWSQDQRRAFANDTKQLVAVSAHSNRTKADNTPEHWRPSHTASWCIYAKVWIHTKHRYQLSSTENEKAALVSMLTHCAT